MTPDEARKAAVILLAQLEQLAPGLRQRGQLGQLEDGEWIALAVVLETAAKWCRQVVRKPAPSGLYIPDGYPDALT